MTRRRLLLAGALSVLVGLTLVPGSLTATARNEQAAGLRAQAPERHKQEKLDSRLAAVADANEKGGADDALKTARKTGLKVKGGRVRVVLVGRDRGKAEDAAAATVRRSRLVTGGSCSSCCRPGRSRGSRTTPTSTTSVPRRHPVPTPSRVRVWSLRAPPPGMPPGVSAPARRSRSSTSASPGTRRASPKATSRVAHDGRLLRR